jgi:hypothetical protein
MSIASLILTYVVVLLSALTAVAVYAELRRRRFEPTPAGLGITVAWGLPYFRRFVPHLAEEHIPVDRRATKTKQKPVRVLLDAIRFPSDPDKTILEANDVAVLLRSDSLDNIVVWFPGPKILFGGCLVKSEAATDLGNTADADLASWPRAVKAVLDRYPTAALVVPGHGAVGTTAALTHTIDLLTRPSSRP